MVIYCSKGKRGTQYKGTIWDCYLRIRNSFLGLSLNLPGTALRKGLEARAVITKTVMHIIEQDPTAKTDQDCCLSAIVGDYPSEIEQKVLALMLASLEGTTNAINALMWILINNPDILGKLQKEICEVEIEPKLVTDFHHFPYLNKVIQETLRLYGVDIILRTTKKDLYFKQQLFPKNTDLLLVTGYEHQLVSDPQQFNPDREEKYKWEPFGGGPRNCLGKAFVLLEMKMLIYHLLKDYDIKPEKKPGAALSSQRLINAKLIMTPKSR